MSVNPLVSIALCTYNGEKFLANQLDSLLSQQYENIEIVAVDDCSTDTSWDILQTYARMDGRLRIYQNEYNLGHTCNFEKAIKLCIGNYVALADQDDIWEPAKIEVLVQSIGHNIMVYHNSDFVDEQDKRIGNRTMASQNRMYDGESSLPVILANCIHGHAIFFDSKLKEYLFPFNKNFSHDWAIVFAAFNTGSVKYVNSVLVHYRQHQNSITDFLQRGKKVIISKERRNLAWLPVNIDWLNYCLNFKYKKQPYLIDEACVLFSGVINGKGNFQCFVFMMKYFDLLFYTMGYKRRGFFSRVNFVRKLCFN